jgi:hypothetical protein
LRSEDARSKPESEASAADPAVESTDGKQAHADPDDLASLGSALPPPSLRPGDAIEEAEAEDTLDLGRLVAAATRNVKGESGADNDSDAEAAEAAFSTAPGLESALAATAASLVPPRQRPTWIVPMLVGIGLGAVIAGAAFALAAGRTPPPDVPPSASAVRAAAEPESNQPAQGQDRAHMIAPGVAPSPALAMSPSAVPADPAPNAAGHPLAIANAHPVVAPRRPANPEPAVEAPAAAPPVPDERTSLLKPKVPAVAAPGTSIEALAEAADPGANKDAQGEEANAKSPSRVDQMLDEALAPDAQRVALRQRQALAAAAAELPTAPSRDEVTKAMTVLLPAIRGCAMGQTGLMTAGIVVHNDGRVASVDITGAPFANTPSGRCMEGVMRRAQFPRFKQPIFRIKFPFAIQ